MAKKKPDYERGKIETISLARRISFNGKVIKKAVIEIDHINYGLNRKTRALNKTQRTNFKIKDIVEFIMLLDGEMIVPDNYIGKLSQFSVRIDCPVKGRFFGKEFLMIFDTHYDKENEIHTITLIPGW